MGAGVEHQVLMWVEAFSYPAVLLLLLSAGVGAPVSEELILLAAGALCAHDAAWLPLMIFVGMVGVVLGDGLLFHLGARWGPQITSQKYFRRWLTPHRIQRAAKHFERSGARTVFLVRFLPGMRAPSFFVAGTLRLPARTFFLADALGALITTPLMCGLGFYFGPSLLKSLQQVSQTALVILVVVVMLFFLGRKMFRSRGPAVR